jgi:hypothetical protein
VSHIGFVDPQTGAGFADPQTGAGFADPQPVAGKFVWVPHPLCGFELVFELDGDC